MKKTVLSRVLLFCLLCALTAALSACGNSAPSSSAPASSEPAAASSAEEASASAPAEEPAEEASASEAAVEPAEEEATSAATEETTVPSEIMGTLTESSYVNDYFGIRYDAPADWYVLSRDETAAIIGMAVQNLDNEKLTEMYEDTGYVTDLYAMATTPAVEGTDSYNNVNITIQDIGKLYGTLMDEKKIAEASLDSVKESLESLGLTDVTAEVTEMDFLGKPSVITTLVGKAAENSMYQKQVYLKNGSAVACITATAIGEDKTDEILSAFAGSDEPAPAADEAEEESAGAAAAPASDADMAGMALSSGTISVDGDLFTLGTKFNEISSNWHLSSEDAEKYADYTLNPMTTSGSAMSVYKDAYGEDFTSFHVMLSVMNASDDPIPYLDGTIDYLNIPGITRMDSLAPVVLPGGLTLESTEEDFTAAYGAPTYEYDDESTDYRSVSYEDGEVELQVTWTNGAINDITLMN